jgi:hypothetical protein
MQCWESIKSIWNLNVEGFFREVKNGNDFRYADIETFLGFS